MNKKKNKKIHLCILAPWAYGLISKGGAVFGGAEINLYYLAKYLAKKKKYQVTFLIGDYGQPEIIYLDGIRFKKIKNLFYDKKQIGNSRFLKRLITEVAKETQIAREFIHSSYDIILVTTASLLLTRTVLWGKYMGNAKVIFRFANDTDVKKDYFKKMKKNPLKDRIYWWGIRHADWLVCQTQDQKNILLQTGNYQIEIIENAFSACDQKTEYSPIGHILWVARANEEKRPELFLNLAVKIPEEKFVMIIPGNNPLKKKILRKAREIKNLQVIDYVSFDKIQMYFNKAKLFVNTSLVEGFPNTFIQAGNGGIPILSFCINPDNVIGTYHMGYVCNDSLKSAAHFIRTLKKEEGREMGENAYQYVKEYHNIDKAIAKYENLILKLIKSKQGI